MSAHQYDSDTTDSPEREQLLGRAILLVAAENYEGPVPTDEMISSTISACGTTIRSYSDYTLSLLCNPELPHKLKSVAAKGVHKRWDDQMVSDFLNSGAVLQAAPAIKRNLPLIGDYLRTLKHYSELAPTGEQHATERSRQVSALLRFTIHAVTHAHPTVRSTMNLDIKGDARYYHLPFINNAVLRGLLIHNTQDREAAIDIVTTRNVFEVEHIIVLLDTASAPLSSGSL
jgi:hypothetical protein